jgi:hypothetical protein
MGSPLAGQDTAHWLPVLLAPVLQPGEQIAVIGVVNLRNFPLSKTVWMFDGMTTLFTSTLGHDERQAFAAFTDRRAFLLPGSPSLDKKLGQVNMCFGCIQIWWAAARSVKKSKMGQKHGIDLEVRNPNTGEQSKFGFWYWHKEDGVQSQADFVQRAHVVAEQGAMAARNAGFGEPPIFFEVIARGFQCDRPDWVAIGVAKKIKGTLPPEVVQNSFTAVAPGFSPPAPQPPYFPMAQAQGQAQPQAAAPPPPPLPVYNCQRCGTQLVFVAQYQRWFCPSEQQYV